MSALGEIGKECVFIIANRNGDIDDDDDLQSDDGYQLAINHPNSGPAITYQYMSLLEPKFKRTTVEYIDGMEALLRIEANSEHDKVKALMLVMHPRTMFPEIEWVIQNNNIFHFVAVNDWDLDDRMPDGSSLYEYEDAVLSGRLEAEGYLSIGKEYDIEVETICTRGLIIANKDKLNIKLEGNLARAMLRAKDRLSLD